MTENKMLKTVLSTVAMEAKKLFGDKLCSVVLFGSYARGDFDIESDIDVMILADISLEEINRYTRALRESVYKTELEHDCVLSLCVVSKDTFEKFKTVLPFYKNISEEGVKIAV